MNDSANDVTDLAEGARAPSRSETCGTCGYSVDVIGPALRLVLVCHANPPQIVDAGGRGELQSMFPPVKQDWLCGCWVPKSPKVKP
jgi:hypothetical protein